MDTYEVVEKAPGIWAIRRIADGSAAGFLRDRFWTAASAQKRALELQRQERRAAAEGATGSAASARWAGFD